MFRSFSLVALASAAMSASAVLTVFTSRAAFEAATAGGTSVTETFDTDRDLVLGDNLYNGINYRIVGSNAGGNDILGGRLRGDEFTGYSLDLVFGAGTTAFGADFFEANSFTGLNFTINGETVTLGDSLAGGTGFFGVVSSTAFTTVDITSGPPANELYFVDNLTSVSGIAPGVPGPAAALPFALMALRRRKRA